MPTPATPDHQPKKCSAHSRRTGKPCNRWAIPGGNVCHLHGGASSKVRGAAAKRIAEARIARQIGRLLEQEGVSDSVDPLAELLYVVTRSALWVRMLGQLVGELIAPDDQMHIGNPEHDRHLYGLTPSAENTLAAHPHQLARLYGEWCDRHARNCKLAIDAGIAERQVRLAEQQGELIVQVIRAALAELGLDASDPKVAPVVARHLRAVAG